MAYQELVYSQLNDGIRNQLGAWISAGSRIYYVHHTGGRGGDPPEITSRTLTTLNSALQQCRSGMGDVVAVLEGHAENIVSADQLSGMVANTKVIGLGYGNARGTFTWTTSGATVLIDTANCCLVNLILNMDPGTGTTTVTAPMTVSAAGCGIYGCTIRFSTDANSLSTTPILLNSCTDFTFNNNLMYGATAGECTTAVDIVAADRLRMWGNHIAGATSNVAVGIVRFKTTASVHIDLRDNFYANRKATSTAAVTGLAGVSGVSHNELFHYLDNTSTTMWLTSPGIMAFFNPRTVNLAGEAGMLSTVVST